MGKTKILIVEDNLIIAMGLSRSLKNQGYAVCHFAHTAQDALNTIASEQPDLVLMDIHLGEQSIVDGIEAAILIKEHLRIPIAFTTAYVDRDTRNRAQAAQPVGYFTKPINYKELHMEIEAALLAHREERGREKNEFMTNS